jgi:hypothetical protein
VIATTNTTTPQPIQIWVGNQETFRFNPPGASAPAWSIQRGGGNPRGLHAVDLQSARAAATQVASGDYSVIGGGSSNTASGDAATVGGGYLNTASGDYATVGGGEATPPAALMPPLAGAIRTPPAACCHRWRGLSEHRQRRSCHRWRGLGNTASGSYATVGGGSATTPPAGYTALFREDSISGSATAALASVGRRRRHRRTSARTRTLLPLWMWTCGCIAGTAHMQPASLLRGTGARQRGKLRCAAGADVAFCKHHLHAAGEPDADEHGRCRHSADGRQREPVVAGSIGVGVDADGQCDHGSMERGNRNFLGQRITSR